MTRILYCHCAYAQVVPKEVKEEVLKRLCESGAGGSATFRQITSEAAASAAGRSAKAAPASTSGPRREEVRFHTVSGNPAGRDALMPPGLEGGLRDGRTPEDLPPPLAALICWVLRIRLRARRDAGPGQRHLQVLVFRPADVWLPGP